MDHTRDNPLKRFSAFWIALLLVTTFGIGCIILRPLTHGKVETAYQAAADEKLAIKAEVLKAESEALNASALGKQMSSLAKTLNSAPAPGAMPVTTVPPAPTEGAPVEEPPVEGDAPAEVTPEPSN
jgi:hypothetical protein